MDTKKTDTSKLPSMSCSPMSNCKKSKYKGREREGREGREGRGKRGEQRERGERADGRGRREEGEGRRGGERGRGEGEGRGGEGEDRRGGRRKGQEENEYSIEKGILHYIQGIRDERVLREVGQQSSSHRIVHICYLNINILKDTLKYELMIIIYRLSFSLV